MKFGSDLSNYQKQLTRAHADALVAGGCTFAMIGRQWNNRLHAPVQREHLRAAGITNIGEYLISLSGVWPELFPETKYVAVDVEPGSEFTTEPVIDDAIVWVQSQGRVPLIYSASWAWSDLGLAGVTKYADQGIGLWNAKYDGRADGFELAVPFGGWTRCVLDQYTDSWQDRAEIPFPLDMNSCEDDFWGVATEPAPQDEYRRGWNDHDAAVRAALDGVGSK